MPKFKSLRKYPGVQFYESETRRFNGKPYRCFYIRYRNATGKMIREKIGWESPKITAAYAFALRNDRINSINLGGEAIPIQKKKKQAVSFSTFVEDKFLPWSKVNKKASTHAEEEKLYRIWLKPFLGDKAIKDISPLDIEKIKQAMKKEQRSPRRIEYALAVLRHILNMAKTWGFFEGENPVKKVSKPKADNRRHRFLSPEEAGLLLEECKRRSHQLYEICLLSLHTGMRAGEIFNLTWADIDLENELILIRDPKNKSNRVAYMDEVIKDLFLHKTKGEPSSLVFTDTQGRRIKQVSNTFDRAVEALEFNKGLEERRDRVVFHTLRHTFASWLAIEGTPIYTIKELLGHKTLAMTTRYSHLIPDTKKQAIKAISKRLSEATKEKVVSLRGAEIEG